tara:strand:- start:3164 stop:3505 length:342 start_codon:yes stop_codon:yes gene_type:complete
MNEDSIDPAPIEEAPKKSTRAKAPAKREPVVGDDDFNYNAAVETINAEIKALEAKIEELTKSRHDINAARPVAIPATHDEIWKSQRAIRKRIDAKRDDQKTQVAAVLREMKLL